MHLSISKRNITQIQEMKSKYHILKLTCWRGSSIILAPVSLLSILIVLASRFISSKHLRKTIMCYWVFPWFQTSAVCFKSISFYIFPYFPGNKKFVKISLSQTSFLRVTKLDIWENKSDYYFLWIWQEVI